MSLRTVLGSVSAIFVVGWIAFISTANSFRASFGATPNGVLSMIAPVAVALLMLSTAVWPHNRPLLHTMALVSAAMVVACIFLARETLFVAACGVLVFGLWFLFYYRAIWARIS